ncbi:MAG: glycosyltransferase 87 family protein [Terriglobia bacterium]
MNPIPAKANHDRRPRGPSRLAALGLLLIAVAMLTIFLHLGRQSNLNQHIPGFVLLALMAGALYLAGVFLVERFPLGRAALLMIVAFAAVFRLVLLTAPPSLSNDVYRYQWEGRVQRHSINPYTVFPAEQGLEKLQDRDHPLRTGAQVVTAYPPLSEFAFSWVHNVPGYKRLFTALDFATLGVLLWILALLKEPLHRCLIYAWSPAVLISFSLSGHYDSLAILALMLAVLLIIAHKPLLSNVLLALSFVSKFFAVLFLPLLLRRKRWRDAAAFAAVAVLAYLPFAGAGWGLFRGVGDYAAEWEGNDSLFRLIHLASVSKEQAEFVAGVLLLGLVVYVVKSRMPLMRAGLVLMAGLLLLSPNAFPWYFTWSMPFLCFTPNKPWLLMSVTAVLGYAPVAAYAAGQPYRNSTSILLLEYAPVIAWLVVDAWRARWTLLRQTET